MLYAHHVMSITWVYHSNDQIFVLIQGTGEWGKQEWCLKSVISFQTSVSQKSFLVSQPQIAQVRVPKDPRGRVSAASSLNSAPCAPGREEGRKRGAWWLRPPYTAVFLFPPKPPCGPSGGQDSLCQVVGAFLLKKLI